MIECETDSDRRLSRLDSCLTAPPVKHWLRRGVHRSVRELEKPAPMGKDFIGPELIADGEPLTPGDSVPATSYGGCGSRLIRRPLERWPPRPRPDRSLEGQLFQPGS